MLTSQEIRKVSNAEEAAQSYLPFAGFYPKQPAYMQCDMSIQEFTQPLAHCKAADVLLKNRVRTKPPHLHP